jgi:hypothetical protein
MFTYLGLEGQNTLTSDWSMLDGNEINAGQVRIGGYSGTGTNVPTGQNGTLIKIRLEVSGQCGTYPDGQQSTITIESYFDDLTSYLPQSLQGTFTLTCCSGDISLPTDIEGAWGDLVFIPVNVAGNSNAICGFQFDFVFDPNVLEFKDGPEQRHPGLEHIELESGLARNDQSDRICRVGHLYRRCQQRQHGRVEGHGELCRLWIRYQHPR